MLRFDGCSLDLARREVRSGGQVQHLEPQAFDLLAYLVEHRGRVVPKEELLDRVWGDQFVSDAALTTRVKEVRRAIGDDGRRQRLVRNVRGRGYRFVGEIAQPAGQSPAGAAEPILGRTHDIAGVARLLSMSRLVTLVGAGGVGKTRLAVEVAAGTGAQAPDGAFFVDLSALASAQAVVPAILRSVDLQVEGDLAALRGLSALDALVVLDNCEHLIEPAAAAAQVVLGFGGRVRILATSRERLGVRGERVWPVSPLDVTAARQLFVDRARAVSPGFDPHSADATVVQRVVDEVDRLPLAIEMAAARVGAMGMAELAALVTTRLDLLRSPHRGTTDRHRTLAAVIAWSEGLLDDSERTAFAELSAFAGPALGADLDGVIDGGDALDRVCRLVERSLVIAEVSPGPTRYRMLETVRRHAAACAGNDKALRLRHATWFTETAEDADALLRTPAERKGHEAIEARVDELRAAHQWARSQAPHLAARLTAALQLHAHTRLWSEPAQWAVELAHIIDEDEPLASQVWAAMANAAAHQGRFEEGTSLAERALRSADPRAAAVALEALADIAMYQGDLSRCRSLGRRLQDVGGCAGDNHAVALGHVDEALALAYGTDPGAALDVLGRFERSGHAPSDQAWFHYAEGEAHARADPDLAVAAFEAAIELADEVGNRFLGGVARVSAASVYGRSADPDRALRAFPRLISDWQRRGNLTHLVTSLRNVTELFVRVGAHDAAAQLFGALHGRDLKGSYGDEARRLADAEPRSNEPSAPASCSDPWRRARARICTGRALWRCTRSNIWRPPRTLQRPESRRGTRREANRIYVDHGLTGTDRARPGLREALAACRSGDTLVVTKLDRLARSLTDARNIVEELTEAGVTLNIGGSLHDPTDPVGRLLFNVHGMIARPGRRAKAVARERRWSAVCSQAVARARCRCSSCVDDPSGCTEGGWMRATSCHQRAAPESVACCSCWDSQRRNSRVSARSNAAA